MDDKRMKERITAAVEQRCETLAPDPFLAARVMRMAGNEGETKMKKKLSVGFVLCIVLMLLSLTAIAAVVLSGMELVEQEAVPTAQENDGEVRRNEMYSYKELVDVLAVAAENGISLEGSASIMEALAKGEGYYEEEVIMAICREAFGGLFYEWTVEQRHWYEEMMVQIGFQNENGYRLPGEGEMPSEEARALSRSLLLAEYGADLPLTDPAQYRIVEDFDSEGWYFTYYPKTLTAPEYHTFFAHDGSGAELHCTPQNWDTYTEQQLDNGIDSVYGYRTYTQHRWGLEGWYAFGQMLPAATRTDAWSEEYDGYLATAYLLPAEGDITENQAKTIALNDAGASYPLSKTLLLLGDGDQRIWKVTLSLLNAAGESETRSWEIDAATGDILHRMTFDESTLTWARYMLHSTYEAVRGEALTVERATELAIADLRQRISNPDFPFDDPDVYDVTVRQYRDGSRFSVIFNPKSLDYGRCYVWVNADGSTELNYAHLGPLNADNLHDRMGEIHGSSLTWDQSLWVQFDQLLDTLGEPLTFEGKLFAATSYPDASTVKLSLDDALDAVQADIGTRAEDPISWVLIGAEGDSHPVWKIRMGTWPANMLYEVDAMTGEVLDREIYVIQRDDFDHNMKMYTLRSTYMPAALAEFGPVRIAMELTVKSDFDVFSANEVIFMDSSCYAVTVEGMTVTFASIDGMHPSYRTTILDNGTDAVIERIDP